MNLTPILIALLILVAVLIICYLIPWIKTKTTAQQRENIYFWIRIACSAAEQLFKSGEGQKKKQYVLEFLQSKNLKVDMDELDKMIEAVVLEINREWRNVESKQKLYRLD